MVFSLIDVRLWSFGCDRTFLLYRWLKVQALLGYKNEKGVLCKCKKLARVVQAWTDDYSRTHILLLLWVKGYSRV